MLELAWDPRHNLEQCSPFVEDDSRAQRGELTRMKWLCPGKASWSQKSAISGCLCTPLIPVISSLIKVRKLSSPSLLHYIYPWDLTTNTCHLGLGKPSNRLHTLAVPLTRFLSPQCEDHPQSQHLEIITAGIYWELVCKLRGSRDQVWFYTPLCLSCLA